MINSELRAGYYMLVVEVGEDAHNPERGRAKSGNELYHWVCPHDMPVDGFLIREHALRNALTDDDDGLSAHTIGLVEVASSNDWNAQRCEISRRYSAELGARIFFLRAAGAT